MKQQHHPKDAKTYIKGANRDVEKEYLNLDEGSYIDACNMRPVNMDGDVGALAKIKGEEIKYPNIDNSCTNGSGTALSSSYTCIGKAEIQQKIVEFWVDNTGVDDPIIRIDGVICAKSSSLPLQISNPLQIAVNETCKGGEIYVTDYAARPMFFNVEDLQINAGVFDADDCTEKYFSDFNLEESNIQPSGAINIPRFVEMTSSSGNVRATNGTGGLPVGTYSYAIRYVDATGNPTNIGMFTPTIPVIRSFSADSDHYPYAKTYGDVPLETNPTSFGIKLKIKVDNTNNYGSLEVIRIRWTSGTILGTPPAGEIILKIALNTDEVGSFDVFDNSLEFLESVTDEQSSVQLTSIARAKAIRYFENKLYLGNIEYDSLDMEGQVIVSTDGSGASIYPTIEFMGKAGHKDPFNYTYYKSYMSDEEYGFAAVAFDEKGTRSFALPITGGENVKMNRRRDEVSASTKDVSFKGIPSAALNDGTTGQCHEVFDLIAGHDGGSTPLSKTYVCGFINMANAGRKCWRNLGTLGESGVIGSKFTHCTNGKALSKTPGDILCFPGFGREVDAKDLGFYGLHPHTPSDAYSDHDYQVAEEFYNDRFSKFNPRDEEQKMFAPNYYAKGFTLHGYQLPSWASGFSIVRTKAAERVSAQGMAFYALKTAESSSQITLTPEANYLKKSTKKHKNKVWFYAADADQNPTFGLYPQLYDALKNGIGSGEYTLKVEAPLGFGSEYYSWNEGADGSSSTFGVDMISYVRLMRDEVVGTFNPRENASMGINGYQGANYPAFGKWRADNGANVPPNFAGNTNTKTFGIKDIKLIQGKASYAGDRGGHYWEVTLDQDIYEYEQSGDASTNEATFDKQETRRFHEPAYICSIVRENNTISASPQIQDYIPTGHIQHKKSLIAISQDDNTDILYDLVDERWEDCIQDLLSPSTGGQYGGSRVTQVAKYFELDRFVTVSDENGTESKWLNVTYKSVAYINTILTALQATGSFEATDAQGNKQIITGVYNHADLNGNQRFRLILGVAGFASGVNLSGINKEYYIPKKEWRVYIEHNNKIPIRFFGGDTFVGENIHPIIDGQYTTEGKPVDSFSEFKLSAPMPYHKVDQNERLFIPKNLKSQIANNLQISRSMLHEDHVHTGVQPSRIRQWLLMYTLETRLCSPYYFSDTSDNAAIETFFPSTHYRQRPHKWEAGNELSLVHAGYTSAYGNEEKWWAYGGFRFRPRHNIDYAQYNNFQSFTSKPKVGFNDDTLYCTRVIWSEENPINVSDSANVRTFLALSAFDVSDDTGAIKYLWDDDDDRGNNVYAFTDEGVVMLLTDKRILSEISGGQLASVESPQRGIQKQIWINKKKGMNDEMWRTAAETGAAIFWANRNSAYRLEKGKIEDIGRVKYHDKLHKQFLSKVLDGYDTPLTGVFNTLHKEYWITFNSPGNSSNNNSFQFPCDFNPPSADYQGSITDPKFNNFAICDSNGHYGVNPGFEMLIGSTATDDSVLLLGGVTGTLLTNDFKIAADDKTGDQPLKIKNPLTGEIFTIEPGNAMCVDVEITRTGVDTYTVDSITVTNCPNPFKNEKDVECLTLMWSDNNKRWIGTNTHDFDRYLSFDNLLYGMRNLETYELNKGDLIYDSIIEAHVINASSGTAARKSASSNIKGDASMDKEFIRIRLSSDTKPDEIEFYETEAQMDADTPVCVLPESVLKDYHGYEQYIPRKSADKKRLQGRIMFFKITHRKQEDFKVIGTEVQYKTLK